MTVAPHDWPEELQRLRAQGLALQASLQSSANSSGASTELQTQLDAVRQRIADLVLAPAAPLPPRPSARLLGMCLALVLLVGVAGYAWKGQPEAISPQAPPDRTEEMVAGLARRLQQQPEDVQGWTMLGRSYFVLGRHQASVDAYRKALALHPEDPDLMADLADALASQQEGSLEGEPAALLERALTRAPDHLKALALAGTRALRAGDRAGAIRHWQRLQSLAPAEHPLRAMAEQGLVQARDPQNPAQDRPAKGAASAPLS